MTVTGDIQAAIGEVPAAAWTPAYDGNGQVRDGAWVADIQLLDLGSWPAGMRVIVRKERPHPGAQLRFTDIDGHRFTCFSPARRKASSLTWSCGTAGRGATGAAAGYIARPGSGCVRGGPGHYLEVRPGGGWSDWSRRAAAEGRVEADARAGSPGLRAGRRRPDAAADRGDRGVRRSPSALRWAGPSRAAGGQGAAGDSADLGSAPGVRHGETAVEER